MTAPHRTCIGCRRVTTPDELVRVVRDAGGGLAVGRDLPGRGAWLCRDSPSCVVAAARRKAFSRALREDVAADAVASLQSRLADRARMEGFPSSRPPAGGGETPLRPQGREARSAPDTGGIT